jgi:glycosyltransferase involved in cell wall biosynthesis
MHIGIDASPANRRHRTGTEWYTFNLIAELAKLDHDNIYTLYINGFPAEDLQDIIKDNPNFSIKILVWPFRFMWGMLRLSIEMFLHAPDVLFVPANALPLYFPNNTVNTIHDLAFLRECTVYRRDSAVESRSRRRLLDVAARLLSRGKYRFNRMDYLAWSNERAAKKARRIIAVSNFTKEDILHFYPKTRPDKVTVVYNGYSREIFRKITNQEKILEVLAKYGLEKPYFLYVGRLEKKKNTPLLVEAFALYHENHPQAGEKLVLIGNASYGYDEVKYAIEEYNLNRQVIMPGWVEEDDMPYIYNGALAFIFPTKHEGFGIPVLESLACGLATAASDLPVIKEVAGDAVLYFNPLDKEDIAAAMSRLSQEEGLRVRLEKEGEEQVKAFSWEKCAHETLEVLIKAGN